MSIRTFRALVCDSSVCTAAPSTEALIQADENKGALPAGWTEYPDPAHDPKFPSLSTPRHTCPSCTALGIRPESPLPSV